MALADFPELTNMSPLVTVPLIHLAKSEVVVTSTLASISPTRRDWHRTTKPTCPTLQAPKPTPKPTPHFITRHQNILRCHQINSRWILPRHPLTPDRARSVLTLTRTMRTTI